MEMTTGFVWEDRFLLGYAAMDETHREFVELVDQLLTVDDGELASVLAAFAGHAEAHFAQERQWMESGDFPARACHIEEHDKVLASLAEVRQLLAEGDCEIVRELARALKDWFRSMPTIWIRPCRCGWSNAPMPGSRWFFAVMAASPGSHE